MTLKKATTTVTDVQSAGTQAQAKVLHVAASKKVICKDVCTVLARLSELLPVMLSTAVLAGVWANRDQSQQGHQAQQGSGA